MLLNQEDLNKYYENHSCCPKCGLGDIKQTCVGMGPPDTNKAYCGRCKWRGIVDDLVPKKETT